MPSLSVIFSAFLPSWAKTMGMQIKRGKAPVATITKRTFRHAGFIAKSPNVFECAAYPLLSPANASRLHASVKYMEDFPGFVEKARHAGRVSDINRCKGRNQRPVQ